MSKRHWGAIWNYLFIVHCISYPNHFKFPGIPWSLEYKLMILCPSGLPLSLKLKHFTWLRSHYNSGDNLAQTLNSSQVFRHNPHFKLKVNSDIQIGCMSKLLTCSTFPLNPHFMVHGPMWWPFVHLLWIWSEGT